MWLTILPVSGMSELTVAVVFQTFVQLYFLLTGLIWDIILTNMKQNPLRWTETGFKF